MRRSFYRWPVVTAGLLGLLLVCSWAGCSPVAFLGGEMALEKDGTCPSPDCADWETLVYVFPTDPEAQQKIEWDAGICRCGTLQFDSTQGQPPIDDTCPGSCPSKNNNAIYLLCYDGGHGKPDKDRCYCVCLPDHDVDKP